MAKLKDLIRGVKPPRKPCTVTALDGTTELAFCFRLLSGQESQGIEERAQAVVGTKEPKPDNVLYARAKMVETLLAACLDAEVDADESFFTDAAEVLRYLDDARIAYVYQEQRYYQSQHAPTVERCTFDEFIRLVHASTEEAQKGGDPERPFAGLPCSTLKSFAANAAGALMSPGLSPLLLGLEIPTGKTTDSSSFTTSAPPSSKTGSSSPTTSASP